MGYSSDGVLHHEYVCKQSGTQGTPIFQPGSFRQESIWERCLEREVAKGPQVCLPTSKHHLDGSWKATKMGRGPDHDHNLLARSELVPEIMCQAIEPLRRFRPLQCTLWNTTTRRAVPKVMKNIQLTTWRLTLPSVPRVASEKKLPGR